MSDFDDFFAKRLDEEASFPNRAKNWKHMSKRLDAFDSGLVKANPAKLRYWQIAGLLAVVTAAIFICKNRVAEQKVLALQQEIAAMQSSLETWREQVAELENRSTLPSAAIAPKDEVSRKSYPDEQSPYRASTSRKRYDNLTQPLAQETKKENAVGFQAKDRAPEDIGQNLPKDLSKDMVLENTVPETNQPDLSGPPNALQDSSGRLAQQIPGVDSIKKALARLDSLIAQNERTKDSLASTVVQAPEVKPVQTVKNRFRIGAQGTVGWVQPKQKGVTVLRGQGFTVEAKIFRSFWLSASADWLHHEVSTENFVSRFHPHHDSLPKPPGGGGGGPWQHSTKLVMVESAPRQQYFGLALRYALPIHFWLRPSVRVAHDWVHISPTLVTYKFQEDDPGWPGPNPHDHKTNYTAEKFDAQWLSNQWRFGIGLEKELPNWAFGLWADYSKDFASTDPSFDVLYLRAGAQYRF